MYQIYIFPILIFLTSRHHWLSAGSSEVINPSNQSQPGVTLSWNLWGGWLQLCWPLPPSLSFFFFLPTMAQASRQQWCWLCQFNCLCRSDSSRGATHNTPFLCTNRLQVTINTREPEKEGNQSEKGTLEADQWKHVDSGEADARS